MNGCGMTMMGVPQVIGGGADCNNYLDTRNEHHVTDQAMIRFDQTFKRGDSLFARYSFSSEKGFMPQNLPGFGANHDNLSQNGTVGWNHIFSPRLVNMATITASRLAMHRTSENSFTNDIVSQLGITGVGFGGEGAFGAPWFAVQGYSGMGDTFIATPMHAWDTILEARDTLGWQIGRHSLKAGWQLPQFYLADVGLLSKSWLLSVHEWLHHSNSNERWHRLGARQFPAWPAGGETTPGGYSSDATAPVVRRRFCPGQLSNDP